MKYLLESGAAPEMFVGQIPQADDEEEGYGSYRGYGRSHR
jgi:hypothetical protein